jgi:hypothetical protein
MQLKYGEASHLAKHFHVPYGTRRLITMSRERLEVVNQVLVQKLSSIHVTL